jgi:pimeloyl-ACP methyl ester carboxylesterase
MRAVYPSDAQPFTTDAEPPDKRIGRATLTAATWHEVVRLHAPYSKRAMAADGLALMRRLGHERFAVVGHDRADDLRGGHRIESGHHMAEEAPGEVAAALLAFLGSVADGVS